MLDIRYNEKSNVFYFSGKDSDQLADNVYISIISKIPMGDLYDILTKKFNGKEYLKKYPFTSPFTSIKLTNITVVAFDNRIDAENALNWINSVVTLNKLSTNKGNDIHGKWPRWGFGWI